MSSVQRNREFAGPDTVYYYKVDPREEDDIDLRNNSARGRVGFRRQAKGKGAAPGGETYQDACKAARPLFSRL